MPGAGIAGRATTGNKGRLVLHSAANGKRAKPLYLLAPTRSRTLPKPLKGFLGNLPSHESFRQGTRASALPTAGKLVSFCYCWWYKDTNLPARPKTMNKKRTLPLPYDSWGRISPFPSFLCMCVYSFKSLRFLPPKPLNFLRHSGAQAKGKPKGADWGVNGKPQAVPPTTHIS